MTPSGNKSIKLYNIPSIHIKNQGKIEGYNTYIL
jgi:hypothetical protein